MNITSRDFHAQGPTESSNISTEKSKVLTGAIFEQMAGHTEHIRNSYLQLILRNHDVFSDDKFDLGLTHVISHKITLKDCEPVYINQFRLAEAHRSVLLQHLQNWL